MKNKKALVFLFGVWMIFLPIIGSAGDSLVAPDGYLAIQSVPNINASDDVLLLKDVDAWNTSANEQILRDLGIAFSVAGSGNYGQFNLTNYKLVIVVSDQPQAFYNAFQTHLSDFDSFVRGGGVLMFNGADKGWQSGFWTELPGGLTHQKVYDSVNHIIDAAHPITKGMPASFVGNYASHDQFLNIPAGAKLLIRNSSGVATTIEYSLGSGTVIASAVTLEACYAWKWQAEPLLVNTIKYALQLKDVVPQKPPQIRVIPDILPDVTLPINDTITKTLTIYNDGQLDLNFSLRIQNAGAVQNAMDQLDINQMPNDVSGSENPPPNYAADIADVQINAGDKIVVLKDVNAWRSSAEEDILKKLEVSYSVAKSSNLDSMTLGDYKLIIVASDQPQAFYDKFHAHLSNFDAFVRNGGILIFNGADKGWENGFWKELPGGVTHQLKYDKTNHIVDPNHPFAGEMPATYTGNYASHDYFQNIPAGASLITKDSLGNYTTIAYSLGKGQVFASGVTLEASYAWGWVGGKILVNMIRYALGEMPPPVTWLTSDTASGSVAGGSSKAVILTYNSKELQLGKYKADAVITSNDAIKSVIKVPALLEVKSGNCPIADAQNVTTCSGVPKDIVLTAKDPDNDALTFTVVSQPANGTLSGTAPNLKYTPKENFAGADSFTFKAGDGACDSNIAAVSVTVQNSLMTAEPAAVSKELARGASATQTLKLTNSGCGVLKYQAALTEVKYPEVNNIVNDIPNPPMIKDIPPGVRYVEGELIVKLAPNAGQANINDLKDRVGAMSVDQIPKLNIEVWKLPPEGADAQEIMINTISILSEDPNVIYAEPNYILHAIETPDDPKFSDLWGLDNKGQPLCDYEGKADGVLGVDVSAISAWDQYTKGSSDVVVAVIDTGVDYSHEDLKANMWVNDDETPGNGVDDDGNGFIDDVYGYDFANNDGDPMDGNSHGTHCAGTIGAVGNNKLGVVGVAQKVRIMGIKFLSDNGYGDTNNAIKGIIYASDNGAHILSNSWGGGSFSAALKEAIDYSHNKNVLFVAAAGNHSGDNDKTLYYPSCYDVQNILSVAAHDCTNKLAWFTAYGKTTVDVSAPGVRILSTVPGNKYGSKNGTSMATPHVSGVAALLKAFKPSLSALDIKRLIMENTDPVTPSDAQGTPKPTVTDGSVNAQKALAAASGNVSEWVVLSGNLTGNLQPGASVDLTVKLDASGDKLGGNYTAKITAINQNDPKNPQQIVIPVTMTIPKNQYAVTVNKEGNGKVKVNGTEVTLPWQNQFNEGAQVKVEAIPDPLPWKFSRWKGDVNSEAAGHEITVNGNKNLTAVFSSDVTYKLTIEKHGEGVVKVKDAEVKLPYSGNFAENASVTIEAVGDFDGWSGDHKGNEAKASISMTSDKAVKANFKFRQNWTAQMMIVGEKKNEMDAAAYENWMVNSDVDVLVNQAVVFFGVGQNKNSIQTPPDPPKFTASLKLNDTAWGGPYFKYIHKEVEEQDTYLWILQVNPHGNEPPPPPRKAMLSWDPNQFNPSGTYSLKKGEDGKGEVLVKDMRAVTQLEITGEDKTFYFTLEFNNTKNFELNLKAGWNMISLPVVPLDARAESLFPDAEAIFEFSGGDDGNYKPIEKGDNLQPNKGYWIKIPSDRAYAVNGQDVIRRMDAALEQGWHMIGSPNGRARLEPMNKIEVLYGFDETYYEAYKVEPGKGYWILIKEGGADVQANTQ